MIQTSSPFSPKALICDVDGTLTEKNRRLDLDAVTALRTLVDNGIPVVLASGNTFCSMAFLCKMIGTDGTLIAENGGVYRIKYDGEIKVSGDHEMNRRALERVEKYMKENGIVLNLYSARDRMSDIAFQRTIDADIVRSLVRDLPVDVLDSGYAIHLTSENLDKGIAFAAVAAELGLKTTDFAAIGDSSNDIGMLERAGFGISVGGKDGILAAYADYTADILNGKAFAGCVKMLFPELF